MPDGVAPSRAEPTKPVSGSRRERGTEVSVSIEYDPPTAAGRLAGRAVKFIAEGQVKEDIRNFKRLMETGEIPTTLGQPAARKESWKQSQISIAQNPAGVGVQSNSSDTSTTDKSGSKVKSGSKDTVRGGVAQ